MGVAKSIQCFALLDSALHFLNAGSLAWPLALSLGNGLNEVLSQRSHRNISRVFGVKEDPAKLRTNSRQIPGVLRLLPPHTRGVTKHCRRSSLPQGR